MGGHNFNREIVKEYEDELVVNYNTRLGLILFSIYFIIYSGFIFLSGFFFEKMSAPFLFGLNLSIVYGFSLILIALILALIYMKLCRKTKTGENNSGNSGENL